MWIIFRLNPEVFHEQGAHMKRLMVGFVFAVTLGAMTLGVGEARATHVGTLVLVDGSDTTSDVGGCGNPLNPCNTIQAGINHANPGDTVS